jgi:hypothetical protein
VRGGKHLRIGHWKRDQTGRQSLPLCPTVQRYFAACAARAPGETGPVTLKDLPSPESFDFVELPGGFAVVHEKGVLLLDDWRSQELDAKTLQKEFELAARRVALLHDVRERVKALLKEVGERAAGGSGRGRGELALLEDLTALKLQMRTELAETLSKAPAPALRRFREVLETRWGVGRALEEQYEAMGELETTLRDHSELRTNRMIGVLTLYGFPAVLFAAFFQFIFQDLPFTAQVGVRTLALHGFRVNWVGILAYLALTAVGIALLRRFLRPRARHGRQT